MRLPFQVKKTFLTTLSKDEVIGFVMERLSKRSKFLFLSSKVYVGSIKGTTFNFYRNFDRKYGRSNPKILGTILASDPTTIDIVISPHYFRILFFLIFPMVFIPAAILSEEMTINGIIREPTLSERITFALFGGGMPTIWCYFDSIRPIKQTEYWIREKLKLYEASHPL